MNNEPFDPLKTTAAKIAKSTFDVALEVGIKVVQGYAPFLAWPVIKEVFSFVVIGFFGIVWKSIEDGASGIIIDLRVNKESDDYKAAVDRLSRGILTGQSQEEIKKYEDQFKNALRKLINL